MAVIGAVAGAFVGGTVYGRGNPYVMLLIPAAPFAIGFGYDPKDFVPLVGFMSVGAYIGYYAINI